MRWRLRRRLLAAGPEGTPHQLGGEQAIALLVAVSSLTSINATMIVGARTGYAMGRDWRPLAWLARWDGRRPSPAVAMVLQCGAALLLVQPEPCQQPVARRPERGLDRRRRAGRRPAAAPAAEAPPTRGGRTMNLQARRRTLLLSAAGLALAPPRLAWSQDDAIPPRLDVPFVPTPQEVVERMLSLARIGKVDTLYDLGCGDGRIVVTAAKKYGAHGVGVDLNPERIAEARANAKKAGVEKRVRFKVADLFQTDLSAASVVSLYLLPDVNRKLRPRLWGQLKTGSRVVSHAFDMGPEWPPERTVQVDGRTIYLWTITAEQKAKNSAQAA
jgi:hypothetical protein